MEELKPRSLLVAKGVERYFRPGMMSWHHEHGFMMAAVVKAARNYGASSLYPWVYSMYSPLVSEDGLIKGFKEGDVNLGSILPAVNLFPLYEKNGEERFKRAIDVVKKRLMLFPKTSMGVFWYRERYPYQVWADGLYFSCPFMALAGLEDEACSQLLAAHGLLLDKRSGMMVQGFDESRGQRWADAESGASKTVLSTSTSLFILAALCVLEQKKDPELLCVTQELFGKLLMHIGDDGILMLLPLSERKDNKRSPLATLLFSYALFKGSRLGIIGKENAEKARELLSSVERDFVKRDEDGCFHILGTCAVSRLGGLPYRDGSEESYLSEPIKRDDFKSVGAYILASAERELVGSV